MSKGLFATLVLSSFAVLASPGTSAAPIINNFGFSSPDRTITFDEILLPQGTAVTTQYAPLIRITPNLYFDTAGLLTFPGISGHNLGNFDSSNLTVNPFSIVFSAPQTSAAFGMTSDPTITTFTALLHGDIVESFSQLTTYNDPSKSYYGFSGIVFDEIQVSLQNRLGLLIDNIMLKAEPARAVTVMAAPEPGSLALVGVALAALVATRRPKDVY
jgi:hypothetical protein